jgi:sugar phosphate isomerase/epimerase
VRFAELLARVPEAITWVWARYIPVGSLTLLAAFMKVGKSTLTYALAVAVAQGQPFLGFPTRQPGVLILAVEEHARDVVRRLQRFGASPEDNIYVHSGHLASSTATVEDLRHFIEREHIGLVIVDTLARYWDIADENNNAEVIRCLSPLLDLARQTNAAVLLIHHERKTGGDNGRGIRGGSALFGLVDQALMFERRQGATASQRVLRTLGRYEDSPAELILNLEDDHWSVLGTPDEVDESAARAKVLEVLSDEGQDVPTLAAEAGLKAKQIRRVLESLAEHVVREGKGRRGDPYTYRRAMTA